MFLKVGQIILSSRILLRRFSSSSSPIMSTGDLLGVDVSKVLSVLENFAPKALSESWDNTGLLVEPYSPRCVSKILLTNDLTEDVALEAAKQDCELIISYHPPIFAPMKSVIQRSWKERIVSLLLEKRIYLYSPHTSWDCVQGGVNDWLASAFNPAKSAPITPHAAEPNFGAGRLVQLETKTTLKEAITKVKELTGLKYVRLALGKNKQLSDTIQTVALCAGSGASVLKSVKADLYLTGEMLHHDVLDAAQKGTSVILTNHSDSERGFLKTFSSHLETTLNNQVKVIISQCDRDPLDTV